MPPTDNVPSDNDEAIRTILTAVIRLEGSVEKLATGQEKLFTGQEKLFTGQKDLAAGQEKLAVRVEQLAGMIQLVDARIDRLGEAFIRHEHPHDHPGEAA